MPTQKDRILNLLVERGDAGVLNIELNEICFRYGGRLHDLRKDGHRIRTTHIKNATWRFTLLDEPATTKVEEPQYMEFLELLKPSPCCGEIQIDGMCGGCREHI